jgi:hypothetical protein
MEKQNAKRDKDPNNELTELTTIYSSNIPVECHILRGRLETEGIPCFIFDEHTISIHPFRAVAIGGVKLKVPIDKIKQSQNILNLIADNKLVDEDGEYQISEIFDNEIKRQNEILTLKYKIRSDATLLRSKIEYNNDFIGQPEFEEIIKQERKFLKSLKRNSNFHGTNSYMNYLILKGAYLNISDPNQLSITLTKKLLKIT